ncbi:MAG: hypothetical protein EXQ59_01080 [Acidobacteria bacterium]|nr:hypothetical protein [Acidobacteriota bacterium]
MIDVLWVSAVGCALLFFALAGLVGLMYLLTAPWLFRDKAEKAAPPPVTALDGAAEENAERERRRRAAALSVAAACAEESQLAFVPADTPADWRLLHRARQLGGAAIRRRARQ